MNYRTLCAVFTLDFLLGDTVIVAWQATTPKRFCGYLMIVSMLFTLYLRLSTGSPSIGGPLTIRFLK
jgi:hypothetical protein